MDIPEGLKKAMLRKAKDSKKEEFDVEQALREVVDKYIYFYNHYKTHKRFGEKFSEMMFEQYLEDN